MRLGGWQLLAYPIVAFTVAGLTGAFVAMR